MKKTKPSSSKEHNGEVRGSILRKMYLRFDGDDGILFFFEE